MKKLAMLLATVDAAIVYQEGKTGERDCSSSPSLTYPDAAERKMVVEGLSGRGQ